MEWINECRKTTILRHPTLTCLTRFHTINLLSGCPYECRYCYTQSFQSHPGWGRVIVYANAYDLLAAQLPRMRQRPRVVYFSTACEPFVPNDAVLDLLYRVQRLLLQNGVAIMITTKSSIPARFIELFARHPQQVHVQVGLTTADDAVRRVLEPNAAPAAERLASLDALHRSGVPCEVRADPIIPELTDTEQNLRTLFDKSRAAGVSDVVLSYLFLRPATARALADLRWGSFEFQHVAAKYFTKTIENYCGQGIIRVVDPNYRKRKHEQIRSLAAEHGLRVRLCGCKNPDVTTDCCHPRHAATGPHDCQMTLPL